MNANEPDFIAWEYCGILSEKPMGHGAEPVKLYRHPVKTLTDEEIISIYQSLWKFLPSEEPDLSKKCGTSYDSVCPPSICDCQGKSQKK